MQRRPAVGLATIVSGRESQTEGICCGCLTAYIREKTDQLLRLPVLARDQVGTRAERLSLRDLAPETVNRQVCRARPVFC